MVKEGQKWEVAKGGCSWQRSRRSKDSQRGQARPNWELRETRTSQVALPGVGHSPSPNTPTPPEPVPRGTLLVELGCKTTSLGLTAKQHVLSQPQSVSCPHRLFPRWRGTLLERKV